MALPQKRWFRVADVAKRWAMPLSDIEDYALDDMLPPLRRPTQSGREPSENSLEKPI